MISKRMEGKFSKDGVDVVGVLEKRQMVLPETENI